MLPFLKGNRDSVELEKSKDLKCGDIVLACIDGDRFVLHRTESTVYAANLEVASASYGISKDGLINSFRMILQDWNTGET